MDFALHRTFNVITKWCPTGSPMMVTVDGGVFEALLSNMVPGKTYQVTVSSVKGLEESDPSTDTVTTGRLSPLPTRRSITSAPWVVSHSLLPCIFPALDRPQGLTAVNVTDTSALLLWQPSYATVDGYLVTYSADTGGFLPFFPPSGKLGFNCAV